MLPQTAFVVWTNWYVSYFGSLWLKIPPNTDALPHCLKMSHSKSSILFFFSPQDATASYVWISSWSHTEVATLSRQQVTAPVTCLHFLHIRVIIQVCREGMGIGLQRAIHPSRQWREGERVRQRWRRSDHGMINISRNKWTTRAAETQKLQY